MVNSDKIQFVVADRTPDQEALWFIDRTTDPVVDRFSIWQEATIWRGEGVISLPLGQIQGGKRGGGPCKGTKISV